MLLKSFVSNILDTNLSPMDFLTQKKAQQRHRKNTEAEICQNCEHLEIKPPGVNTHTGKPLHRYKCRIGRFNVSSTDTCMMYEEKQS